MTYEQLSIKKVYILYKILSLYYKIELDMPLFKRYLYTMDKIHLEKICTPYFWEDYIFIDDDVISYFIEQNKSGFVEKDFDKISKFSLSILQSIIENNELIEKSVESINHMDYLLDKDAVNYYTTSKENHFILRWNIYQRALTEKNRSINIDKIIN